MLASGGRGPPVDAQVSPGLAIGYHRMTRLARRGGSAGSNSGMSAFSTATPRGRSTSGEEAAKASLQIGVRVPA